MPEAIFLALSEVVVLPSPDKKKESFGLEIRTACYMFVHHRHVLL